MTTADLINEFRLLADDNSGRLLWTDAELCVYAAEGELEAARRARLIRDDSTANVAVYSVTAGARSITLDPRVMFVREVQIGTFDLPLRPARKRDLDLMFPKWDTTTDLGEVLFFCPDKETGVIWFSAPFPTNDTVTMTVIREPMAALTTGLPTHASATIDNGGIGPIVVTAAAAGAAINGKTLTWGGLSGVGHESLALAVTFDQDGVSVQLATDANGDFDDAANTFALVTAAINAACLGLFTAENLGDAGDVVSTADSDTFAGGGASAAVNPEIRPRYHHGIVNWMIWRAFGKQDAEVNDTARAKRGLDAFEEEFGKKSRAIDETYITEQQVFDEHNGVF